MPHYDIAFRWNGVNERREIVGPEPKPDDQYITEQLLRVLYPDEVAPFGLINDKIPGQRPDPALTSVDVLAKYGINQVMYSVDGGAIYTVGK